ncbi:hypothetical protein SAMN05660706_11182 [Desulfoscipio geothermicus DSM 3669]|uniref:Uncharacterized protein n=1 Tax=Desulfoscipio geothermicus DSM 3669 TaxID=1121426 RepID=A0A1I6DIC2_9FIRM|nr:hypothetical protein SAMN05660706_11182 [Desulfoscipio geothermicus DSM 3669]
MNPVMINHSYMSDCLTGVINNHQGLIPGHKNLIHLKPAGESVVGKGLLPLKGAVQYFHFTNLFALEYNSF